MKRGNNRIELTDPGNRRFQCEQGPDEEHLQSLCFLFPNDSFSFMIYLFPSFVTSTFDQLSQMSGEKDIAKFRGIVNF